MFSTLATELKDFFQRELGNSVKSVMYGTPELLPTTAQPALLINAIGLSSVPSGSQGIPIEVTFRLYGLTSQMSDNFTATVEAQNFLWRYTNNDDNGLYPVLLAHRNKVLFTDIQGRKWILFRVSAPKFYAENVGKNYLGAIEIDITLQTILHTT